MSAEDHNAPASPQAAPGTAVPWHPEPTSQAAPPSFDPRQAIAPVASTAQAPGEVPGHPMPQPQAHPGQAAYPGHPAQLQHPMPQQAVSHPHHAHAPQPHAPQPQPQQPQAQQPHAQQPHAQQPQAAQADPRMTAPQRAPAPYPAPQPTHNQYAAPQQVAQQVPQQVPAPAQWTPPAPMPPQTASAAAPLPHAPHTASRMPSPGAGHASAPNPMGQPAHPSQAYATPGQSHLPLSPAHHMQPQPPQQPHLQMQAPGQPHYGQPLHAAPIPEAVEAPKSKSLFSRFSRKSSAKGPDAVPDPSPEATAHANDGGAFRRGLLFGALGGMAAMFALNTVMSGVGGSEPVNVAPAPYAGTMDAKPSEDGARPFIEDALDGEPTQG